MSRNMASASASAWHGDAAPLEVFTIGDAPEQPYLVNGGGGGGGGDGGGGDGGGGSVFAGGGGPSLRRLGRTPDRPAPDPGSTLRLGRRVLGIALVLFGFIGLCVTLSKLGGVPRPAATECADGNACTRDLMVSGGCVHAPLPDGAPCAGDPYSACYGYGVAGLVPVVAPAQASPACVAGRCAGPRCAGACARTSDCPQIKIHGAPKSASCIWDICVYAEQAAVPVASSQCASDVFTKMCGALLSPSDPFAPCLVVSSLCEGGQLVCIFSFACAAPIAP